MKSQSKSVRINGKNLSYFLSKGRRPDSFVNQILRKLRSSAIHYNRSVDYKELSKKYDYVFIASGQTNEARELGVW
jgi:hypothetical protein